MKSPLVIGALCLIVAELMFAGVGALVKYLSTHLTQAQLVFFRNFFALAVLLPWLVKIGPKAIYTQRLGLHVFRSVAGIVAMYCFFYVLANMALAPAMMALLTAPFIVPLVAKVWLEEDITRKTMIALVIGFAGVALVLKPTASGVNHFALLALFCAIIVAINKCSIRKLSETEPSARIVLYFAALGTFISAFPLAFAWQPITLSQWLWLGLMGLLAGIGQLLMTKAFQLASPVKIGLLTYSSVLFAGILGYVFWNEPIGIGLVLGTVLIVFAANMTIRQKWL